MSVTKTIHIDPGSELAEELRRASSEHSEVVVKAGSAEYQVTVKPVPKREDVLDADLGELSRRAILETAGSWKGIVDAEELKAYIRERRLTPSRGNPRD